MNMDNETQVKVRISIIVVLTSVAVSFLPISPMGISTISAGVGLLGGLIIGVATSA